MSISRSVWTFCYRHCGPLWPNPHIYKASQRTRMVIVIGHPQDTVQCTGLGDRVSCVSLHLAFTSLFIVHSCTKKGPNVSFYCFINSRSCTIRLSVQQTTTFPDISQVNKLWPSSFCTETMKADGANNTSQVRSSAKSCPNTTCDVMGYMIFIFYLI